MSWQYKGHGSVKYPVHDLAVGEWRFIQGDAQSIRSAVWQRGRKWGWKFATHATPEGCEVRRIA